MDKNVIGSAFAGIGGFDLGMQRAGFSSAWQIEIDADRRKILNQHWPDVPKFSDVRNCNRKNLSYVDILCGGFPCTDLSMARFGSHTGLQGKESGLFYEFARIANEIRPRWIVIENVSSVTAHLPEIEHILSDWKFESKKLRGESFGSYTRRERVFIVGYLGSIGRQKIFDSSALPKKVAKTRGTKDTLPMCLPWKGGLSLERLGACVLVCEEIDPLRIRESDGIPRRMDSFSDTKRWNMIGDSVCVDIVEWIGNRIRKIDP